MNLGIPPQDALGTNKLQASFGSGSAAWHYTAARTIRFRDCARGFGFSLAGAALGALAVQHIDPGVLKRAIPVLLLTVAVYVICKPTLGEKDVKARMSERIFEVVFGLGIGFYDGFFGPGTGTFWAMACILLLGFNLTRATGYTKLMNFASNISSLLFFLIGRHVLFLPGLVMGAGQLIGARLGARMVITRGTKFIRPIFLTVVIALTIRLLLS